VEGSRLFQTRSTNYVSLLTKETACKDSLPALLTSLHVSLGRNSSARLCKVPRDGCSFADCSEDHRGTTGFQDWALAGGGKHVSCERTDTT